MTAASRTRPDAIGHLENGLDARAILRREPVGAGPEGKANVVVKKHPLLRDVAALLLLTLVGLATLAAVRPRRAGPEW